jgi:hypothetical protein
MADEGDDGADDGAGDKAPPGTVTFNYIKSGHFRVVLAEGAWGGISPSGRILMNFYNDRAPIPRAVTHEVAADGQLGPVVAGQTVSKNGIVREVEVAVSMDAAAAEALVAWLQGKLTVIRRAKLKKAETGG